ncbi:DUF4974 domain-containing protein [Chitinophaga sp. Mgbs1]|uniref:DUF4974 domain-containing protein n=1 Tax=Chitinophaga solisilvae TaxID=1233460 RepID=A0A3S1DNJ4_9BACT|nr:DUF4974 domain-containing protein [Chitinophaga solisilvae]
MHHQEFRNIVRRYLQGNATLEEQAMVEDWFAAAEDTQANVPAEELQLIREQMLTHIRAAADYPVVADVPPATARIRPLSYWLQRVAVIVITAAAGYSMFYMYTHPARQQQAAVTTAIPAATYRVVTTATQKIRRVVLPDSSVVTLNRGASMYYTMPFGQQRREVTLENGEAFFEVRRNAAAPFLVYAGKTATTVLGTAFNVKLGDHNNIIHVVVKTGKIKVAFASDSGRLVTPDHGVQINTADNSIQTFTASGALAAAWCGQELVFRQHTLKEAAAALESRYQVTVTLTSPSLAQYRVSGNFSASHTVDEVLDALCLVHRLTYKKNKGVYFIY